MISGFRLWVLLGWSFEVVQGDFLQRVHVRNIPVSQTTKRLHDLRKTLRLIVHPHTLETVRYSKYLAVYQKIEDWGVRRVGRGGWGAGV